MVIERREFLAYVTVPSGVCLILVLILGALVSPKIYRAARGIKRRCMGYRQINGNGGDGDGNGGNGGNRGRGNGGNGGNGGL